MFTQESKTNKSNTPPLPEQREDDTDQMKTDGNGKINSNAPITTTITKRGDWDMFAEQDIDSNFDVRSYFNNFIHINQKQNINIAFQPTGFKHFLK